MHYLNIKKEEWDKTIEQLLLSYSIFAPVINDFGLDYEAVTSSNIGKISYNKAKPATSLKTFFLPVKENVTSGRPADKFRIILGVPNCDIQGLKLLDEIYLDKDFNDPYYRNRREKTILIATDCFEKQEHCHCTSYGVKPFADTDGDLAAVQQDGMMILRIITAKGEDFCRQISRLQELNDQSVITKIEKAHEAAESILRDSNRNLPDYKTTGKLVSGASKEIWEKYSAHCVSCGACATICPTCSCFLLIDKPDFEKVKQLDVCQYPGFERVAGGEDSLFERSHRFRNRYMCKYVWKPEKFNSIACTGCGRCIEACIGKINKNELFLELAK
ncbi:MAG: 4Fe-4S dicluster domain-containing protein [Bacteroidota bacterium]|nr:4Fe-4S dicluster domain-containing protein [Bacteroidota bacterium]